MINIRKVQLGEVCRKIGSRDVYLIVGVNNQGILITSLMQRENPAHLQIILPHFFDDWQRDIEIDDLNQYEKDTLETAFNELDSPDTLSNPIEETINNIEDTDHIQNINP